LTTTSFMRRQRAVAAQAALLLILLGGCAAQRQHREGLEQLASGQPVTGVENLRRASELEPDNLRYRADFLNQRAAAARSLVERADSERRSGALDAAVQSYREALRIESSNDKALQGLQRVEAERRADGNLQQVERYLAANQSDLALEMVRRVTREVPQHARALALQRGIEDRIDSERQAREEQIATRAAFRRPVTLSFRDTPLKMVFEAFTRAAGINIVVDRDVKNDLRTTIFVKDAAIEDAIDVILIQNQLEKRVLNGNTLLIYPATAAKQKELAELKVRSFQLNNIEAAFMGNILKTMLKTKDLVSDPKTNILVMRDTPEAVSLAERLVAANDVPDPEVMLEVEVLEVASSRVSEIGLKLPTALTLSTPAAGTAGSLTVGELRGLGRNDLLVSPLSATLNLMLQDGDTNILASPRIRTRNKEKARILVGDKLPQITNLISPQQSGQNSVVTGSIQYVDVGIKLEVEAQVYADNDVGIKLNLEVSNVTDTLQTESGRAYQIGTRSAQTTLRLRDGETQVLAGLISDSDRSSAQKVPGIGQMPMVGRLFSSHSGNLKKTEIVLSITPRIIRPQTLQDLRNADAWSGSEATLRDRQLRIDAVGALRAEQTKPDPNAARSAPAAAAPAGRAPIQRPAAPAPAPVPTVPAEGNDVPSENSAASRPAVAPRASPVTLPPSAPVRPATSPPGGNPPAPEAEVAPSPAGPASAPGA